MITPEEAEESDEATRNDPEHI
jgi:hypothetical protein